MSSEQGVERRTSCGVGGGEGEDGETEALGEMSTRRDLFLLQGIKGRGSWYRLTVIGHCSGPGPDIQGLVEGMAQQAGIGEDFVSSLS